MGIRVPSKFTRDGNKLRDVKGDEEKERKKRDARMPRHAIDVTQTVALNDYDIGILLNTVTHFNTRFWNIKKCWMTVAGQKLQVQERRFRIVRPTGNPDEPLRFRHASPQGEEPPAGARRLLPTPDVFQGMRSIREVVRRFGDDEEEVTWIEMLKNRREGTRMCRVCKSSTR
ncbi:hypothetical protein G5I_03907 [Acromyrmex echinatior]|uniref:Uncharacterized protein n=1 Tax=Acromyrmex echinatior TaxID=103372 RepID=F4WE76_ACREC|nr:hypothetical protein G5I_03907 [Acromyrmex echinatior]